MKTLPEHTDIYCYTTYPFHVEDLKKQFRRGQHSLSEYPKLLEDIKRKCHAGQHGITL